MSFPLAQRLQAPVLKRSCATIPVREKKDDVQNLRERVLLAYEALPMFHGRSIVINGVKLTEDSWRSALEMALDDTILEQFSLEQWLGDRVERDGTSQQKLGFKHLLDNLDSAGDVVEQPPQMLEVCAQPLIEVETYRSLDNLDDLLEDLPIFSEEDHDLDEQES